MHLVNPDEQMSRTGIVDLVVREAHFYGVKIVNKSKLDLYPHTVGHAVQVAKSYSPFISGMAQ
jgi:hypothetical protein